jgi:hypothetical protein
VSWGEERVYYYGEDGSALQWVALAWTDLRRAEEFEAVSGGEVHFRLADLLALRRALDGSGEC